MAHKILIADDDPLLLQLIEHKLSAHGHKVLTASDGRLAWDISTRETPDLIVLDAMMPVRDGLDVLRSLKGDARLKQTPVMMLTARRQENDIVSALKLGAADYMTKPFMPDELVARVERLLDEGAAT